MQVKRFIAENLPKALTKAKTDLGDNIVILETRDVVNHPDYPGKRMVQASIGYDMEPKKTEKKKVEKWQPPVVSKKPKLNRNKSYASLNKKAKEQSLLKSMEREQLDKPKKNVTKFDTMINDILAKKPSELEKEKSILEELSLLRQEIGELGKKTLAPANNEENSKTQTFPAEYGEIEERLKEYGIQDDLAYSFVNQAYLLMEGQRNVEKDKIISLIQKEMAYLLEPFDFDKQLKSKKQKVILLLGPTGVGKTTMAMKLAANPEIYGAQKVTVVSTDPYGPSEALKAFSRMSGTHIHEEKDIDEIDNVLKKYEKSDVIIVDTPGKSPFAPNQLAKMEAFIKKLKPTDIFLVLSVGADLKDLVLLCANYLLLKPTGIAFTKFDETTQPGKVFSILDVINLPVTSFGDGKRIFIDMKKGNPQYMFDMLFEKENEEVEC